MSQTVKVQVYLPNGTKASIINVTKSNTIKEILYNIDYKSELDYVVFTSTPDDKDGHTPIVNLDYTMEQLNMYHVDSTYIAEISVFNKADVSKYNEQRMNMYLSCK
jgi:hypothetical protein